MSDIRYFVYWTGQITKKSKIWNSGELSWIPRNSAAILYDERGRELCQTFIVGGVGIGKEYSFEGYMVTVECLLQDVDKDDVKVPAPVKKKFVSPLKRPIRSKERRPVYSKDDLIGGEGAGYSNNEEKKIFEDKSITSRYILGARTCETTSVHLGQLPTENFLKSELEWNHHPKIDWSIFLSRGAQNSSNEGSNAVKNENFIGEEKNFGYEAFNGSPDTRCELKKDVDEFFGEKMMKSSVREMTVESPLSDIIMSRKGSTMRNSSGLSDVCASKELEDRDCSSSIFYAVSRELSKNRPSLKICDLETAESRELSKNRSSLKICDLETAEGDSFDILCNKTHGSNNSVRDGSSSLTPKVTKNLNSSRVFRNDAKKIRRAPSDGEERDKAFRKLDFPITAASGSHVNVDDPYGAHLTWTCDNICFPSLSVCNTIMSRGVAPLRSVDIPSAFSSIEDYKHSFSRAIMEEINVSMLHSAASIRNALSKFENPPQSSNSQFSKLEEFLSNNRINFVYYNCRVSSTRKGNGDVRLFLKIPAEKCQLESYGAFMKGDVWILSSTPFFEPRGALDLFLICHSINHGKLKIMELEPISIKTSSRDLSGFSTVHALHGPNIGPELCALKCLNSLSPENMPLLPLMIHDLRDLRKNERIFADNLRPFKGVELDGDVLRGICDYFISTYRLNADQAEVVREIGKWFNPDLKDSKFSPIVLIHGVFGSGKSYLLVVLIQFLAAVFEKIEATKSQILVSSYTNIAVDRIMTGLLESGFTDFLRIGSLKKIDKKVLPYSIHRDRKSSSKGLDAIDRMAISELDEILKENAFDSGTKDIVEKKKQEIISGTANRYIERIDKFRVIGATCMASSSPILDGREFKVVILDECSQISEPLSLPSISRFRVCTLVLVGDPMQLPPQLKTRSSEAFKGLGKTLFSRLVELGHKPVLLRRQYRLHPTISRLANYLFYGGKLVDGVSEVERGPLISGMPALTFVDVEGGLEKADKVGSIENYQEADVVIKLIKLLLESGLESGQMGVICLYKAQVRLIKDKVEKFSPNAAKSDLSAELQVSTIDAFQGAEKDVIILSCSRTDSIGFSGSMNRLNVALTRSRRHLVVVGNSEALKKSKIWANIISYIKMVSKGFDLGAKIFGDD